MLHSLILDSLQHALDHGGLNDLMIFTLLPEAHEQHLHRALITRVAEELPSDLRDFPEPPVLIIWLLRAFADLPILSRLPQRARVSLASTLARNCQSFRLIPA